MHKPDVNVLLFAVIACGLNWFSGSFETAIASGPAPNVILMMADDMGMGDTSAYQDYTGNQDAEQLLTPNMNRLARMGVRFTDAHTPASRCTLTRYALLTGRYSWRNRLKHWVLFGVQGDPMIEADRPTLGTLFQSHGYRTGLVGKWHVGLRYRQSDGQPADGWEDADLTQPMFDTPLDHGFDYCRFTSRSHGTSGPAKRGKKMPNNADQSIGPGHIHGRTIVGATGDGKRITDRGENAYVLEELGSRHLSNAKSFLSKHLANHQDAPFFLYYACNSNHGPHTPEKEIEGMSIAGAGISVSMKPLGTRADYVYENDVVLGSLMNYLKSENDPRNPGKKLIENTIVIFTSDNGAEIGAKYATGPFRSNKASVYEGGHRVPFLVSWPTGNVGDGNAETPGPSNETLIGLQDLYATFAEILESPPVDFSAGEKGAEDSVSVLDAWRGQRLGQRQMFFNDHKEADDPAVLAFRSDDPVIEGQVVSGDWKLFLSASLLRTGKAVPVELFDLKTDPKEGTNLLERASLQSLVGELSRRAVKHRASGGHLLVERCADARVRLSWMDHQQPASSHSTLGVGSIHHDLREQYQGLESGVHSSVLRVSNLPPLQLTVRAQRANKERTTRFDVNPRGLGIAGGKVRQVDSGERLCISFDQDVLVESVEIVAGNGVCGGFYRKGGQSPLAIYCVDADIDGKDQSGILSDVGILKKGEELVLDSSPHFGVEAGGQWRLGAINICLLKPGSN